VPAIVVCHLIGAISGTASIFFAHNYIILLILRAFMGFVVLSQGMFAVVLVMEYVGNDGRMIISTLFLISYSITATCLPWIAYYLRNWRILAVFTSVSLLIVPLVCK
jgi:MFS family permease